MNWKSFLMKYLLRIIVTIDILLLSAACTRLIGSNSYTTMTIFVVVMLVSYLVFVERKVFDTND